MSLVIVRVVDRVVRLFRIKIILEIKSVENLHDKHVAQWINYLKVSNFKLAILANFHKDLLDHKRIVL